MPRDNFTGDQTEAEAFVQEMMAVYPPKVARKRAKHIKVNDPSDTPEIQANVRTVPGIITQRGCTYAGCKGVVLGPIGDIVHITHGPVGCSYYSWGTRRNQCVTPQGTKNFMTYCFTTDMQEQEIVFGGEKKLRKAIEEAFDLFHPRAIAVYATCPVGLIGDDIHAVSREMSDKFGVPILAMSCEGYKGVSQSAGHHIANNRLFTDVIGSEDLDDVYPFTINLLGEYNIGGDAFEIERILDRCGIRLQATLSGNGVYDNIARAHNANLNVIMCHRSINYIGEMMETKFGIPWIKINFIGLNATAKALRKIAQYFGDDGLIARVEEVIAEELAAVWPVLEEIRPRTEGRLAMLFVGGSRAHHYQELFKDLGMTSVAAGYEFAHRDDYEGRDVLPNIKVDADSRNIEELKVERDGERYRLRVPPEDVARLAEKGIAFSEYEGLMAEMTSGSLAIDDISHHEMEKLIAHYRPSIFCSGIKDKYIVEKMGVPTKQLHNYDYGGPYAGFRGAANFYKEVDRMISIPATRLLEPPWQKSPEIRARLFQAR